MLLVKALLVFQANLLLQLPFLQKLATLELVLLAAIAFSVHLQHTLLLKAFGRVLLCCTHVFILLKG
jgi:hypothetical protein